MILPKIIIPTIVIPFTLLTVVLSSVASFIAAIFGFQLNTEGPKRLLEALLKPRVLISAVLMNLVFYGGYKAWVSYQNRPRFEFVIRRESQKRATPSLKIYEDNTPEGTEPTSEVAPASRELDRLEATWSRTLSAGSFSGVIRSGNSLFIGNDSGVVEELDPLTGETLRTFFIGTSLASAPTIFNGSLYIGEGKHDTHHARIYKFNLKSGEYEGSFATLGHVEGRISVSRSKDRDLIFVPSGSDGIYAVNATSLKEVWHWNFGHTDSTAAAKQDVAYWGTGREKDADKQKSWAVAASLLDGKLKWKRELPASSWMQPVFVGNDVCFSIGEIYFPSELGGVSCFERESGTPTMSFNAAAPVVAPAQWLGTDLIVTDFNGRICRVAYATGRSAWCTSTDGTGYSLSGAIYDPRSGFVVYASRKGGIFSLDPASGRVVSTWNPNSPEKWEATYAPVTLSDGQWIIVDMNGVVRSLRPSFKKRL